MIAWEARAPVVEDAHEPPFGDELFVLFDHVLDHPMAGATVATGSASPRDLFSGLRSGTDGSSNEGIRNSLADTDEHARKALEGLLAMNSNVLQDNESYFQFQGANTTYLNPHHDKSMKSLI